MTSRNDMDKPAMLVTAILAVVLIAASVPFTVLWWGEGTTTYDVDWEESAVGTAKVALTGPGSNTVEQPVNNLLVSNVTVAVAQDGCSDGLGTPAGFNPNAQMTWKLSVRYANGTTEVVKKADGTDATGTFQCSDAPFTVPIPRHEQPALGAREVDADDADGEQTEREAARAGVWDADLVGKLNETSVYVLELTATRGPTTFPLPVGAPATTLAVTMTLTVEHWQALLQETGDDEVVR
ncbi:MAG: hypothetical protein AABY18_08370 [Candidatus Thermoplasmatota archaeon]